MFWARKKVVNTRFTTFFYFKGFKKCHIFPPKTQEQKNFNKEALKIIEVKKSQKTIEAQAIGTAVIPAHKFKGNFIDYYEEYK